MESQAKQRFDFYSEAYKGGVQAMYGLEMYVRSSGLEKSLLELVKTRCSQINGCAYCIDMQPRMRAPPGKPTGGCIP